MVKKIVTFLTAAAVITTASGVLYADASGAFLKDNDAAKALVDKYYRSVMRSYSGDLEVSYRGIIKEGCPLWYYNDYYNDIICEYSMSMGCAKQTDYSVDFENISYSDKRYTIDAEITQRILYENSSAPLVSVCHHTFIVEQSGRDMLITSDISDGSDLLLRCSDEDNEDKTETQDSP